MTTLEVDSRLDWRTTRQLGACIAALILPFSGASAQEISAPRITEPIAPRASRVSNMSALQGDRALGVFHVTADSLEGEVANWPVDHGAPVDGGGRPALYGDEMLWASLQPAAVASPAAYARPVEGLRVNVAVFAWQMEGREGFGAYEISLRDDPGDAA